MLLQRHRRRQRAIPTATTRTTGSLTSYLVNERDRGRFAEQGVVADLQVAPSTVSAVYINFIGDTVIGSDRAGQLLPAKELHDAGATVTLSSDWDADDLSPLVKIQTVLTRPDGRNFPDVETVIPMVTKNVATLLNTNTGVLAAGKLADLVVIDRNIFEIPFEQILGALWEFPSGHNYVTNQMPIRSLGRRRYCTVQFSWH